MAKVIWKYFVPMLMVAIGLTTFFQNPDQPISKSIPIIPGEYQVEIASAFIVVGFIFGVIVYFHQRKQQKQGSKNHL